MRKAMGLSMDQMGAYISQITQGGPAEKAGLGGSTKQATLDRRIAEIGGDIIIGIDGKPVTSFEDILIYIALNTHPGQDVTLTVIRDGKAQEIVLKLGERPSGTVEFTSPSLVP
jgi:serine protease Do